MVPGRAAFALSRRRLVMQLSARQVLRLRGLRSCALLGLGRPLLWLGLSSLPQGPSGGGAGRVVIRQCLDPPSAVASLGALVPHGAAA